MKKNSIIFLLAVLLIFIDVKANDGRTLNDTIPTAPSVTVINNCGNSVLSTNATGNLRWMTGETTSSITVNSSCIYSVKRTVNGYTSPASSGTAEPKRIPTITASPVEVVAALNTCKTSITFGPNIILTGNPIISYKIGTTTIYSPHFFPAGTTIVTVFATNSCGTVTKTFPVTITDNQKPSINCKPAASRLATSARYSVSGAEFNATASDNCGISSLIYRLTGATEADFQSTNISLEGVRLNIGSTTITWRATDASNNVKTCQSAITVSLPIPVTGSVAKRQPPADSSRLKATKIEVQVMSNPAADYFTLQLNSPYVESFKIRLTDLVGRVVEQKTAIPPNSTLRLGHHYSGGIYVAEIFQGKERIVTRLIKQGK